MAYMDWNGIWATQKFQRLKVHHLLIQIADQHIRLIRRKNTPAKHPLKMMTFPRSYRHASSDQVKDPPRLSHLIQSHKIEEKPNRYGIMRAQPSPSRRWRCDRRMRGAVRLPGSSHRHSRPRTRSRPSLCRSAVTSSMGSRHSVIAAASHRPA